MSLQAGTRMAFIPDRYEKINMTLGKFMEHMYLMETEREGRDRMAHYLHQFHLETMLKTPMKYLPKERCRSGGDSGSAWEKRSDVSG